MSNKYKSFKKIVVIVGSVYARRLRAPIRNQRGAPPPGLRTSPHRPFCANNMLVNYVVDGLRRQARSALLHVDPRVEFYEDLNTQTSFRISAN